MRKQLTNLDLISDFLGPGNLADSIFTDHTNNHVSLGCHRSAFNILWLIILVYYSKMNKVI